MPDAGITMEAAIPCPTQDKRFTPKQKQEYREILSKCSMSTINANKHSVEAYHIRNKYMVDNASLVIAVLSLNSGGAMKTIENAKEQGKEVVMLQPE